MNNPTREVIKSAVTDDIFIVMKKFGRPDRDYTLNDLLQNENLDLQGHLRLSVNIREALATPFTKISSNQHGGANITQAEAKGANTIAKCITLVHLKANDKK